MEKVKNKIAINNIEIQIKDVKHKLSLQEAKELRDILDKLFEKEVVKEYIPITQPIWINPWWNWPVTTIPAPTYEPIWTITCGSDFGNNGISNNIAGQTLQLSLNASA